MTTRVPRPLRIPVPGMRGTAGLGHVVKRLSSALGVRPCSGCEKRARALDRRVVLTAFRGKK
jgi:hypothetical protein